MQFLLVVYCFPLYILGAKKKKKILVLKFSNNEDYWIGLKLPIFLITFFVCSQEMCMETKWLNLWQIYVNNVLFVPY